VAVGGVTAPTATLLVTGLAVGATTVVAVTRGRGL
jgi:hypothetical protein